jgi:hypothetical protein
LSRRDRPEDQHAHFGVTDHVDMSGIPPAGQVEERLPARHDGRRLAFGNVGFDNARQAAQ